MPEGFTNAGESVSAEQSAERHRGTTLRHYNGLLPKQHQLGPEPCKRPFRRKTVPSYSLTDLIKLSGLTTSL